MEEQGGDTGGGEGVVITEGKGKGAIHNRTHKPVTEFLGGGGGIDRKGGPAVSRRDVKTEERGRA
jgi:hypothetical protein